MASHELKTCDAVAGEAIEVFRLQPLLVAHLNAVRPALGQFAEKGIERRNEVAPVLEITGVEAGEFKHQHADVRTYGLQGAQER